MRVLPRGASGEVLAIGQKAAYFGRSRHFVNLVQGEGLYGFDGIRRTAELMMDAYLNEKDTEKLVVQKGWGCECFLLDNLIELYRFIRPMCQGSVLHCMNLAE